MKKLISRLLFAACMLFFAFSQAKASHVLGGEITYTNIGPNLYTVKFTMFKDCASAPPPQFLDVTLKAAGCTQTRVEPMLRTGNTRDGNPYCSTGPNTCTVTNIWPPSFSPLQNWPVRKTGP